MKLSVMGVDAEQPFTFGKWHAASDRHVCESGISFTFLRSTSFMQNFMTYYPRENGKAGFVDTRDIAAVAAEVLLAGGHEGKIYTLSGPAALGIAEIAQILSEAAGRETSYVDVSEAAAREGMLQAGLPQWQVDALMELHAANKQNQWSAVTCDIEKATGQPASLFAKFARDYAEQSRAL